MIFLGDIAHPFETPPRWFADTIPWNEQPVFGNLEGALHNNLSLLNKSVIYNHVSLLTTFKQINLQAVTLANNHITDIPNGLAETERLLRENGIGFTGAGNNLHEASQICWLEEHEQKYALLGAGWWVIQCEKAKDNKPGTNPMHPGSLLKQVAQFVEKYPDTPLIVQLHWNYELGLYPQPAHRELAFELLDAGASAIIGHHPHRVGGVEFYKGKPIAYSLGNWWFPQGVFMRGRIRYPEFTYEQMALEWRIGEEPIVHWFEYNPDNHKLKFKRSSGVSGCKRISELTPFNGLSNEEYRNWFVDHSEKRKLLPNYMYLNHHALNKLRDVYVSFRQSIINFLVVTNLKDKIKKWL